MILLTLCAFAIPSFATLFYASHAQGSAIYDADCNVFVEKKAELSKESQKQTSDKGADNCCVSHHCCTAKISFSNMSESTFITVISVNLPILTNQHVSGQIIHGLDRPPKSLV